MAIASFESEVTQKSSGVLSRIFDTKIFFFARVFDASIIIIFGHFLGLAFFPQHMHAGISTYQLISIFCGFYGFIFFEYFGLYRGWRGRPAIVVATHIMGAWASVWLLGIISAYLLHQTENISRGWETVWLFSVAGTFGASRFVAYFILLKTRKSGRNLKSVFIVGYETQGKEFHQRAISSPASGYKIIGYYCTVSKSKDIPGERFSNAMRDIRAYIKLNNLDEVWLTLPMRAYGEIETILAQLHGLPIAIRWIPDSSAMGFVTHEIGEVFGNLTINLNHRPAAGGHGFLKEMFDRLFAASLLIALAPFMIFIAAMVRYSSPGSVFYGHTRIGVNGRRFKVYKFRSMVNNSDVVLEKLLSENPAARAEWDLNQKLRHDPRVTRIGRFLRASSLDELPQLFNVLRGDMSLVGPRPIVDSEIPKYGDAIKYYYAVRPGITGLWQVSGRSDLTYASRVRLDAQYVVSWTMRRDLAILLRTVSVVLARRGAY